ncbi:hypothetical protein IGI37_000274 [Enterococcus sp. AZ194]|uniref:LysM peptidoglycan-binding domain-containing protein n=1 Tax=Enterococcus sp. AZ194 TaxID=2774629 RepID=UPI003F23B639
MEKRIDYRKSSERNKKKKKMIKVGVLSAFGMLGITSAIPAFAVEWTANTPESIQIAQGATSYTMKQGDTLWAIGMRINVNVNTLASVNNIDLSSGQQYSLPVGTVIHFSQSEIKATNSNGQALNNGVKVNDSNKIVKDKPIGTDVSKDVANGKASNRDVVGTPDNTGKLPNPNNNSGSEKPAKPEEKPSTGGDKGNNGGNNGGGTGTENPSKPTNPTEPEKPNEPNKPTEPEKPVDPEKPEEPSKPTNKDVYVTVNVDESGTVLNSTKGYDFISESTAKKVETLDNGNTVTTYTTTKVWRLAEKPSTPTNEDKYVTVNVDTNGAILSSTEGYSFVSESTQKSVQTLENGNTITTYTTTKVWKKNAPTEVVPVNPSDVGNSGILTPSLSDAGAQAEAMHNDPNSPFYWANGYGYKSQQVLMSDGSKWYTIVFYESDDWN